MPFIFFTVPSRATGIQGRTAGERPLRRWAALAAVCLSCAAGPAAAPVADVPRPAQVREQAPAVLPASVDAGGAPRGGPLRPVNPLPPGVATTARVTIGAVGDVLMHGAVKDTAAARRDPGGPGRDGNDDGFGWLWQPIADLLAAPDLTFANLETPIAPAADQGSRSYVFNAPVAVLRALRRAGVDLVSVANNHAFDQGRAGFEETLRRLDEVGLGYVGGGPSGREAGPRVLQVNGLRLAFLAYARFFNGEGNACPPAAPRDAGPCLRASQLDEERAVADVAAAARSADAVVVSLHWGDEYAQQPRAPDVALAHRLADAGALVILGHHPHVLQPVELYTRGDGRVALVAYSLGNFVSNQSRGYVHGVTPARVAATRDGALLRAELARRDYGRGVTRVELAAVDWLPLWTENARAAIQVVSVDRALAAVRAELAALPDPVPEAERDRYVRLRQREELYAARRAAIAAVLGEDLEGEAPPASAAATATATRLSPR